MPLKDPIYLDQMIELSLLLETAKLAHRTLSFVETLLAKHYGYTEKEFAELRKMWEERMQAEHWKNHEYRGDDGNKVS